MKIMKVIQLWCQMIIRTIVEYIYHTQQSQQQPLTLHLSVQWQMDHNLDHLQVVH